MKQVNALHYQFARYMDKARWMSLWHQVAEISFCNPCMVLEVGVGSGILGAILKNQDIYYKSVDIDPDLKPDVVALVTHLPIRDASFDVVVCFQVLEHLPYETFQMALKELARVARTKIMISLPDARNLWCYSFYVPAYGAVRFAIPKPSLRPQKHVFDGEHFWEIGKLGYPLKKVLADFSACHLTLEKMYRVQENPYHHFFILKPLRNR
jgi:predicted SAM-dependent methyltransferase